MKKDKYVNIGGQAVIEGVMMRSPERMAMSVRDEEGTIQFTCEQIEKKPSIWSKIPIVRGCVNFGSMMVYGVSIINKSMQMYDTSGEIEEEGGWVMFVGVLLGMLLAVGLFIMLPTWVAGFFSVHGVLRNLVEGLIRIVIFMLYLMSISLMKDIRRVLMYHGAEHKTIACYEAGEELTASNVKKHSRLHPRCSTTFLFIVVIISILVYSLLIWTEVLWLRILLRLVFLPVVAGVAYEVFRLLNKSDHFCVRALRWPGVMLQKLTTKEPDEDMLEVAIVSFEGALLNEEDLDMWEKSSLGIPFTRYKEEK